MPLKAVVESLEEVPEALREFYEERDGKFVLGVDGSPSDDQVTELKERIQQFRTNNIKLNQQLAELKERMARYDGVDPEEYQRLKQRISEIEAKGVKKADDVEAVIEQKVAPLAEQLKQMQERAQQAEQRLRQTALESALQDLGVQAGVQPTAVPDFVSRGVRIWDIDPDTRTLVVRDDAPVNGDEPLTPSGWVSKLKAKEAPHLFGATRGTGADKDAKPTRGLVAKDKLVDPTPEELGRYADQIAKGEIQVVDSTQE